MEFDRRNFLRVAGAASAGTMLGNNMYALDWDAPREQDRFRRTITFIWR